METVVKADNDYASSEDEGAKTFKDRLEDMPAYNMTVSGLSAIYSSLRGNEYLSNYFNTAENVAGTITAAAKPVVSAATDVALMVAKPVVGEVGSIDGCAAEVLAKVQEKIPLVKQNPCDLVEAAKTSAKDTANYYMEKVQGMTVTQTAVKQLDNAVSLSDLVVELCFPTDVTNYEDMAELERAEEDEDKGLISHAQNVKNKAYRRGSKKLMSFSQVRKTVDVVQFAQNQISETTGKLIKGTNYVSSASSVPEEAPTTSGQTKAVSEEENAARDFVSEDWESIHKTTMFLPKKAMEMTGEVYTSAKEMVFVYSSTNALKEMPSNVMKTVETYYNKLSEDGIVNDVKDKVVSFAYVPTQVISNYMQSSRLVQWIIPNSLQQESIQVIEIVEEASD